MEVINSYILLTTCETVGFSWKKKLALIVHREQSTRYLNMPEVIPPTVGFFAAELDDTIRAYSTLVRLRNGGNLLTSQ